MSEHLRKKFMRSFLHSLMLFTKLNLHKLETSGISDRRANVPDLSGYCNVTDLP
nr:MAG TPA: hypothetical protein [Caudoviricetes sp.]